MKAEAALILILSFRSFYELKFWKKKFLFLLGIKMTQLSIDKKFVTMTKIKIEEKIWPQSILHLLMGHLIFDFLQSISSGFWTRTFMA